MAQAVDPDELIERWTLLPDDLALLEGKAAENRLGFGLLLKSYTGTGRFPLDRSGIPDEVVAYVARQLAVPAEDLPIDFEQRRVEHYQALRKPLDPATFINEVREEMRSELAALDEALPGLPWLQIQERAPERSP